MNILKNLSTAKLELILTILTIVLILAIPQYGVIISFVIVIAYLRRSKNRKELLKSLGLRRPKNLALVIAVCVLFGVLIEVSMEIVLNPVIEKLTHAKIDLSEVAMNSIGGYLIWIVIGFVLGGLLEEILFRGFLMTRISKFLQGSKANEMLALFITSILFGLCHLYQGWSGVISTGIIGFLFGIIFLASNKFMVRHINPWICKCYGTYNYLLWILRHLRILDILNCKINSKAIKKQLTISLKMQTEYIFKNKSYLGLRKLKNLTYLLNKLG